jgi:hypothetical protein
MVQYINLLKNMKFLLNYIKQSIFIQRNNENQFFGSCNVKILENIHFFKENKIFIIIKAK